MRSTAGAGTCISLGIIVSFNEVANATPFQLSQPHLFVNVDKNLHCDVVYIYRGWQ